MVILVHKLKVRLYNFHKKYQKKNNGLHRQKPKSGATKNSINPGVNKQVSSYGVNS